MRLKKSFSLDELFRILTVLNRLVPFTFASILQSLAFIHPDGEDSGELVLEVVHEANDGEDEEEQSEEGGDAKFSSAGEMPIKHSYNLIAKACNRNSDLTCLRLFTS